MESRCFDRFNSVGSLLRRTHTRVFNATPSSVKHRGQSRGIEGESSIKLKDKSNVINSVDSYHREAAS